MWSACSHQLMKAVVVDPGVPLTIHLTQKPRIVASDVVQDLNLLEDGPYTP